LTEHETRIHRNRGSDSNGAAALIAVYHAGQGDVTWVLGEDGERVAAIVPAEVAEFVLANLPPRHGRSSSETAGSRAAPQEPAAGFPLRRDTVPHGLMWLTVAVQQVQDNPAGR
jgi:hypothetical protein